MECRDKNDLRIIRRIEEEIKIRDIRALVVRECRRIAMICRARRWRESDREARGYQNDRGDECAHGRKGDVCLHGSRGEMDRWALLGLSRIGLQVAVLCFAQQCVNLQSEKPVLSAAAAFFRKLS
jgi:hypothetical protein